MSRIILPHFSLTLVGSTLAFRALLNYIFLLSDPAQQTAVFSSPSHLSSSSFNLCCPICVSGLLFLFFLHRHPLLTSQSASIQLLSSISFYYIARKQIPDHVSSLEGGSYCVEERNHLVT